MTSQKPGRFGVLIAIAILAVTVTACVFGGNNALGTVTPSPVGTFALFTPTLPPPAIAPTGIVPNFPVTIVVNPGTVYPSPALPTSAGGFVVPTNSGTGGGSNEIGPGGSSGSGGSSFAVTCTSHSGWVAYTVQAGDTLSLLAQETNTNITDLINANCLTNADVIDVGQVIYLPSLPAGSSAGGSTGSTGGNIAPTVQPVGSTTTQTTISNVWVEPAQVQSGGQYYVTLGTTVTLRAQGVANAQSVVFYAAPANSAATPIVLGSDSNLSDGIGLPWTITDPSLLVRVWAVALGPNGQTATTPPIIVVAGSSTATPG